MRTTVSDPTILLGATLAALATVAALNQVDPAAPSSSDPICAITLDQFAQISLDMHRVEVDALIGCRGHEVGRTVDVSRPGHMMIHIAYERVNRTPAILVFSSERVVSKRYSVGDP